jgi:hypothetical protein
MCFIFWVLMDVHSWILSMVVLHLDPYCTIHMWKLYFAIVKDKSKSTFPYCNLAHVHTPKKWSHLETLMICGWCNPYMLKPLHSIFRHFQHQYWIFLLCRKKNPCLEIQLYGWELDYPIFLLQKFEVNRTTSTRSDYIWQFTLWVGQPWCFCKLSIWCHLWSRVTFWKVCNMAILHNVLVKMVAPKNLDCIGEFRWGPSPSKLKAQIWTWKLTVRYHNLSTQNWPNLPSGVIHICPLNLTI